MFAWFDAIGYQKSLAAPFIMVDTWYAEGGKKSSQERAYGFLLSQDKASFTYMNLDLATHRQTFGPSYASGRSGNFQKVNFEKWLPQKLAHVRASQKWDKVDQWRFSNKIDSPINLLILARVAEQRGLRDASKAFFESAKYATLLYSGSPPKPAVEQIKNQIRDCVGHLRQTALADPDVPWTAALAGVKDYLARFSSGEYVEWAREVLPNLERVAKESAEPRVKDIDSLPLDARVAELVFLLREQRGRQWIHPGECDVFVDDRGEKSPAHQLVRIGYTAVPQLIAVLADPRPTRSSQSLDRHTPQGSVLAVGDVAAQVLTKIANRRFDASLDRTMTPETRRKVVQATAHAWWREAKAKGELQVLVEAVEKGDYGSIAAADRLVRAFPSDALNAISKGLARAEESSVASSFVHILRDLKDTRLAAFAREQFLNGKHLETRLAAVQLPVDWDPEFLVDRLIGELRGMRKEHDQYSCGELIEILAATGRARAINAIAADYPKLGVDCRWDLITEFLSGPEIDPTYGWSLPTTPAQKAEFMKALEAVLVLGLGDTEVNVGAGGSYGDYEYSDPRICDGAVRSIAECFPKKYRYRATKTGLQANSLRLTMLNIWRKENGLSPLALPQYPKIGLVTLSKVDALLNQAETAKSDVSRKAAISSIRRLGLGALPRLADRSAKTRDLHLRQLAATMANQVSQVEVSNKATLNAPLVARLKRLKGEVLSARLISRELSWFAKNWPKSLGKLSLTAERDDTITGVRLEVTLLAPTSARRAADMWSTTISVDVNQDNYYYSSGGGDSIVTGEFELGLQKALKSGPREIIKLNLIIIRGV